MAQSNIVPISSPSFPQESNSQRRLELLREVAAFWVVASVEKALALFEVQDFDQTEDLLRRALDRYRATDQALKAFRAGKEN